MLRYSQDVFLEITNYLSWQHIPFDAKSNVGIITFSAETPGSDILYKHYVNLSEDAIHLEVSSPLEVPQAEKIQLRLLKFCNEVNRTDRMGGVLVLDLDSGKLLCRMTIPFSYHSCGRIDQLLPVPAGMLNYYDSAIRRLIQGTASVAQEKKALSQFRETAPLVSSGTAAAKPQTTEDCRRRQMQQLNEALAEYLSERNQHPRQEHRRR